MNYYPLKDSRHSLFQDPSPLQRIFIRRRSYRKYQKRQIEEGLPHKIKYTTEIFSSKMGFFRSRIEIVLRGELFVKIIDAATSGVIGKVNPWLKRTDAPALLVAVVNNLDAKDETERLNRIAECAMVMQIAILRATELGLATCWMAGVNSKEIEKVMELNKGEEIIAISTLGYPPENIGFTDYDFWANRLISSRRRPLEEIYFYDKIR